MWVSNTATALMMLPIAMSVVQLVPPGAAATGSALRRRAAAGGRLRRDDRGHGDAHRHAAQRAARGLRGEIYDLTIGFGQWMLLGVPVVVVALPLVYLVLTRVMFTLERAPAARHGEMIAREKRGSADRAGARWRRGGLRAHRGGLDLPAARRRVVPLVSDTTIAMAGALLLFMIPVDLGAASSS
jgi:solute carrier family 13 (sodium-dependent dicarboxylate transporter), member 2/3/5